MQLATKEDVMQEQAGVECFRCGRVVELHERKEGEEGHVWRLVQADDGRERWCCLSCQRAAGTAVPSPISP